MSRDCHQSGRKPRIFHVKLCQSHYKYNSWRTNDSQNDIWSIFDWYDVCPNSPISAYLYISGFLPISMISADKVLYQPMYHPISSPVHPWGPSIGQNSYAEITIIGQYYSYRLIKITSGRYLDIGFISRYLAADILIGRYEKNLYRLYSNNFVW